MRKKMLTSMVGLLFLFFGMFVATAKASNSSIPVTGKMRQQENRTARMLKLTNNYNANLSKIKKACSSLRLDCAFFIELSASAFDSMIAACDYAETSSACANAQTWVEIVMEATLDACSQAKINYPKGILPVVDRLRQLRESGV